ncbi:Mor transcription activator family protein [Geopsychrobacter electrodiphilus]|uniref:Mor transcription activator family protein n=1 Tax=Geopsychrobacter electrodiphilus TaxID=225196 RepID=UPI00036E438C|nr:Mor transcription activator family protein [Geopsychrobacter electrodiphilus]
MPRGENKEAIADLFDQLHIEFEDLAPRIIKVMISCLGKTRITFPDFDYIYRQERNRRIRNEFDGVNYEELAIKYRLRTRQIRSILKNCENA